MDFKDGLSSLGLWTEVLQHSAARELLVYSNMKLKAADLKSLYEVEWSINDSKRQKEEDVIYSWELFLNACEKGMFHDVS